MKIAHVAEDKNPVVLGRLGREPGLPTIAFYGHYDVQVRFRSPCASPAADHTDVGTGEVADVIS